MRDKDKPTVATQKVVSRQRKYEQSQRKLGLCRTCPKRATHGVFCKKHHAKVLRAQQKRDGVKKPYSIRKRYS